MRMKKILPLFVGVGILSLGGVMNTEVASAAEISAPPVVFESSVSIEEITRQIEDYYSSSLIRANEKWKDSVTKHDGAVGYYITTYFWVPGSNIGYDLVGKAQRKAIEAKYGKVESKYTYKMETTQHIDQTSGQTQGYITVSASAKCHDRR